MRGWGLGVWVAALIGASAGPSQSRDVILATTTSTRDAGLLDTLVPLFERQTGYKVKVIAVGSGQALEMGRRGDADVEQSGVTGDRKSTRLNSSHLGISYAVF